jgi:diguanylate cyclase (GGDEF)-like protein
VQAKGGVILIRTPALGWRDGWRTLRATPMVGRLRFDRAMERRFMAAGAPVRLQHLVQTGVMALLLFNLFLMSDWYMVPDVFSLSLWLRIGFLSPVVLSILAVAAFRRRWWLATLPPWATDAVGMLGTMLVTVCLGLVLLSTSSPQAVIYRAGLLPVVVFSNLVQRLRFGYSLAASAFVLLVYGVSMFAWHGPSNPYAVVQAPMAMLVVLVTIYTLLTNYSLERDQRQRFLQNERAQALRQDLEQANRGLEHMSNLDPLTGLANRRGFDAHLASRLASPGSGGVLALFLVDVDHFKAFNDRYGHPAGDQCLRHIANALQDQLTASVGLLSRWGGEEFAAVISVPNSEAAMQVSERLRAAVQALAMRHEASATADHVTISIGVSTCSRSEGPVTAAQLLAGADRALYLAKGSGRNGCRLVEVSDGAPSLAR